MLSATAKRTSPAPIRLQARPGRHEVSAKPPTTSAINSRSPTGYARFVATTALAPLVSATAGITKAVPTAPTASIAIRPSSQTLALIPRTRGPASSISAT